MPANQALNWFDIADMTPGLWETPGSVKEFAAPPNAFVTLQDYVPLKGGGLKAFFQATAVGTSGITDVTAEECTGVYANSVLTRSGKSGGGVNSFDALLTTAGHTDLKTRIYRMDQSNDETTWKNPYTSIAGVSGFIPTQFERFESIGNSYIYYLLSVGGGLRRLYSLGYAYGVAGAGIDNTAAIEQTFWGPLAISQQRILVGGGLNARIHYSDVDAKTFTNASQYVDIHPQRGGSILVSINSIAPDDLLISKELAPWVQVAGDLANSTTPIREMDNDFVPHRHQQQLCRVPGGVAFFSNGRVVITDGKQFKSISDQITAFPGNSGGLILGWGTMAYALGQLFAPHGYVYDLETEAWFKQSALSQTFNWYSDAEVWMASNSTNFDVKRLNNSTGTRCTTGVIQTVPYADKTGRNVDIHEVQLFVNTYAATEFKVELIDQTGSSVVTRYATTPSAKRDVVKFLFPATKSEYLSCKITPRATDGTSQAPDIEKIRIGFGQNNLIT